MKTTSPPLLLMVAGLIVAFLLGGQMHTAQSFGMEEKIPFPPRCTWPPAPADIFVVDSLPMDDDGTPDGILYFQGDTVLPLVSVPPGRTLVLTDIEYTNVGASRVELVQTINGQTTTVQGRTGGTSKYSSAVGRPFAQGIQLAMKYTDLDGTSGGFAFRLGGYFTSR